MSKDPSIHQQALKISMKWQHMETKNKELWKTLNRVLNQQTVILSINSSYVDPLVQFDSQLKTIEECFRTVFSMSDLNVLKLKGNTQEEKMEIEEMYQEILTIFENTLLDLVSKDLYKLQLLREMIVWMTRNPTYLQERAMIIIGRVLKYSYGNIKECISVDAPCMGQLAAELAILCNHRKIQIVTQASLALYFLLCIVRYQNDLYEYMQMDIDPTESFIFYDSFEEEFTPTLFQRNNADIAKFVGEYLQTDLLNEFVYGLLKKLCCPPKKNAIKAADLLRLVLGDYGSKVTKAAKIVDFIHKNLNIQSPDIQKSDLLNMVSLLTRFCPQKVVFQLLDHSFPVDSSVLEMWKAVSSESDSSPFVLKTILTVLKGKPGEGSTAQKRFSLEDVNMMPVSATQALCILLPVPEYKKAAAQFFPELLIALILQLHYNSEIHLKRITKQSYALEALRLLLKSSGLQQVDDALQEKDCWHQFSNLQFHHYGVYIIAKTLSEYNFPQLPETLHYLYKLSLEGPRRTEDSVTTVIFLIELLNNFFKDPFPEEFLSLFRKWVNDPNPTVSKLSLQKISTMASVINKVSNVKDLICCIVDSFSSKDKTVTIQAMNTLRWLLAGMDKVTYSLLCVNIASSYFPLMDHAIPSIRAMAIRHFGELLNEMNQYTWMLKPVVLKSLVPLVLFLEDTEIKVVKFNNYGNYIPEVIYKSLLFLRSNKPYLRKAAIILTGYLAKLGSNLLLSDEIELMLKAMEKVLCDEDPSICQMANFTYMLFGEIFNEMKECSFKQHFQRIFSLFQFKDTLLLYHYRGREFIDSFNELDEYAMQHTKGNSMEDLKIAESQVNNV
ncbi:maestro heat-like repeat-containing protein family member 9 isoform X2 [Macrotis lagotis]|uniref:maestro heat-like repeat-containing protein family member 9 isoform X2 n=1 Tax=Macrotis lagotis TaxID=92651 RepID=UPI003D690684